MFWLGFHGMPLFCAAQISNLLRHVVKVRRGRGVFLRLLFGVIHPGVFQAASELARSLARKAGIRAERASSSRHSKGQRGQEVKQSGKKAGERVLGFIEVGGKGGSGGERKVSFRSRHSLVRLLDSLASRSRIAVSRLRGSAVSRWPMVSSRE